MNFSFWLRTQSSWVTAGGHSIHSLAICVSKFFSTRCFMDKYFRCWSVLLLEIRVTDVCKVKKKRVWRQGDEICVDELAGRDICSKRRNVLSYAASLGNRNSWTVSVVFVLLSAKLGTLNWYWSACISKMLCTHQFNSVLILWTHKVNLIDTLEF